MKLLQYFPITFIVCLLCTNASANSDFFGSWANLSYGDQINILDDPVNTAANFKLFEIIDKNMITVNRWMPS